MSGFMSGEGGYSARRRENRKPESAAGRLIELEQNLGGGGNRQAMNMTPSKPLAGFSGLPGSSKGYQPMNMTPSGGRGGVMDMIGGVTGKGGGRGGGTMNLLGGAAKQISQPFNFAGGVSKGMPNVGGNLLQSLFSFRGEKEQMKNILQQAGIDSAIQAGKNVAGAVGGAMPSDWGDLSGGRNLEGVKQWSGIIDRVSKESGVPWQVLASIMGIESGGKNGGVSPAGATGLMQVMPNYWQETANNYGGDLNDPYTNIRTAADVLIHYEKQFGGWVNAAGGYLAGSPFSKERDAFGTGVSDYQKWFEANMGVLKNVSSAVSSTVGDAWSKVSGSIGKAIDTGMAKMGLPYVFGGNDPNTGLDCSSFTQYSMKAAGINLPRTAQEQYNATTRINSGQAKSGDLIFFTGTYAGAPAVSHVGIYLGDGRMLHTGGSRGVEISNANDAYWGPKIYGYGRA